MYPSSVGKREFLITILIIGTTLPSMKTEKYYYTNYIDLNSLKTYNKF